MKKKCVAIIPARGASKGIPRKNARLLNGRPLISYVIEKALLAKCFDEVIVSTDDPEIAFIAQKYGAALHQRPSALAGDLIGLDEVIVSAVDSYEEKTGGKSGFVATIQPTSPLLSVSTIQKAVRACRRGKDTVLTVRETAHLSWKPGPSGKIIPDYQKRLNRQLLPKKFQETGGIVVCKRAVLERGTRFGKNIGVVTCGKKEAIDIDDRYDWWVAEKQLSRRSIVMRVEGYREIGLGHIYRCLTLADRMLDHDITFVISTKSQPGIQVLRSRFYPVVTFAPGRKKELTAIESCGPDIVVNDILDTDKPYIRSLKKKNYRVVNFEDLGSGKDLADTVINSMYGKKAKKNGHVLTGPQYICLRDEFYCSKRIKIKKTPEKVLVLFGGTDPGNLTCQTLRWLIRLKLPLDISVIIGPGFSKNKELDRLVNKGGPNKIEVVSDTKIITKYMEAADMAITSAGRTVFELASLGIPMLVMSQNSREDTHGFIRNEKGVVYLGRGRSVRFAEFKIAFEKVARSHALRKGMQDALLKHNFKSGIKNVWDAILRKGHQKA